LAEKLSFLILVQPNQQTHHTPSMKKDTTNTGFVFLISLVATIGGFLFGFDSGVINGTVDGLKLAFNSDSVATGFNVASMLLGCGVGAFFAGTLADKIGRRAILIISAVLFIISAWGSGNSSSTGSSVVLRLVPQA
jgi:MFS transporter, SP family, sugar:H+ symporter